MIHFPGLGKTMLTEHGTFSCLAQGQFQNPFQTAFQIDMTKSTWIANYIKMSLLSLWWMKISALELHKPGFNPTSTISCWPWASHLTLVSLTFLFGGLPWWLSSEESSCQCRRRGFDPWFGKIPWKREWLLTLVFLPGKSHGQRSLESHSPLGHKESDMTERLKHFLFGKVTVMIQHCWKQCKRNLFSGILLKKLSITLRRQTFWEMKMDKQWKNVALGETWMQEAHCAKEEQLITIRFPPEHQRRMHGGTWVAWGSWYCPETTVLVLLSGYWVVNFTNFLKAPTNRTGKKGF